MLTMLSGALVAALLSAPAQAQTQAPTATDATSVRGCRPPSDAKEAQVLTFDPSSLQAKLAVSLGKDEFKVVTVKVWDRPDDPRPLVPIIEAARITQGKLQFYTPHLNVDPQPVHEQGLRRRGGAGRRASLLGQSGFVGERGRPGRRPRSQTGACGGRSRPDASDEAARQGTLIEGTRDGRPPFGPCGHLRILPPYSRDAHTGDFMRHTFGLLLLGGALAAPLLVAPAEAQTARTVRKEPTRTAADVVSVRGCRPPADAKEAQVLAFDKGSLETKLAVSMGKGEFKVVTIKVWDRPEDPRPVIPVVEAARIMQGKLHFYTPDLNTDPESVSDKFVLITEMGGSQVCWATPSALLGESGYSATSEANPETTPAVATGLPGKGVLRGPVGPFHSTQQTESQSCVEHAARRPGSSGSKSEC
jgi:hypothetical protein